MLTVATHHRVAPANVSRGIGIAHHTLKKVEIERVMRFKLGVDSEGESTAEGRDYFQ